MPIIKYNIDMAEKNQAEHKPTSYGRAPLVFDLVLVSLTIIALLVYVFLRTTVLKEILAIFAVIGLLPVVLSAVKAIIKKNLTIDLLASIALLFSLFAHEWVSASFITIMLGFARLFDYWTEAKTKSIISHLLKFRPEKVRIRKGDSFIELPLSEAKVGDVVIVESGERIPVDGIVESGEGALNESALTGESELVPKKKGDKVLSSTLVESGSLTILTEKVGEDTALSRIILLVDEASRKRAKSEQIAGKFTQWYILSTIVFSVSMYFLGFSTSKILAVLLVVCADDIAVAVPLAFTASIAYAAKRGVVIKGSQAIENLSKLKYLITDKTGTLTKGKPKVVFVKSFSNMTETEIISRFAVGASASSHPVSRAILEDALTKHIKVHAPEDFEEYPGQGISFVHDGEKMLSGRVEFLENKGIKISNEQKKFIENEIDSGKAAALLSLGDDLIGGAFYVDEIRSDSASIIKETKELGVKEWHMLTGDNVKVAGFVAKTLGIKDFHAGLKPEGKVQFIEAFKKDHRGVVGMVGDGVNDAASLALADVSIAMGEGGTDTAIEAADITLVKDNLSRVPEIIRLSQATRNVMKQNFGIWAVTNILGLTFVFSGILGPAGAAFWNFATDFIPIANALKIFTSKFQKTK
jgi:Cd2+/Zn2+-exporting ATPase